MEPLRLLRVVYLTLGWLMNIQARGDDGCWSLGGSSEQS
jgi:hypothetical protein